MAKWRDWMNNNSAIVTIGAVVVLVVALAVIVRQSMPTAVVTKFDVYYFDLDTGTVFTASNMEMAPIASPSGVADKGVKAYMFGCNDCSEKNRFVGYLERYTPKAKDQILKAREAMKNAKPGDPPPPMMDAVYEMGLEIADPTEKKWVPQMSQQGRQIMEKIEGKCKSGDKLMPCLPGR